MEGRRLRVAAVLAGFVVVAAVTVGLGGPRTSTGRWWPAESGPVRLDVGDVDDGQDFSWAEVDAPPELATEPRWASTVTPIGPRPHGRMAVVAVFESARQAREAGEAVWDVLRVGAPTTAPSPVEPIAPTVAERDWFVDLGVAVTARGIGWVGTDASSGPAVRTFGPVLVVDDLVSPERWEVEPDVHYGDHPLLAALAALGAARVIDEHGWTDDFGVGFDLACSAATDDEAAELAAQVLDVVSYHLPVPLLPPWSGEVTPRQLALRREYREANRTVVQAGAAALFQDRAALDLFEDHANALIAGGDTASFTATIDRVVEAARRAVDLSHHEPLVQQWIAEDLAVDRARAEGTDASGLQRREPLGVAPFKLEDFENRSYQAVDATVRQEQLNLANARATGRRVELGGLLPADRFSTTFAAMVEWLESAGCTDVRVRVVDADELWNL